MRFCSKCLHNFAANCSYLVGNHYFAKLPLGSVSFSAECEVSGVKYKSGQKFYIPQNPVQFNDIGCQSCSCDRGAKSCLSKIKCDFSFPCEKFIPASQKKNQCCPTCGAYVKVPFRSYLRLITVRGVI